VLVGEISRLKLLEQLIAELGRLRARCVHFDTRALKQGGNPMTVDTEYLEVNGVWYTNTPMAVAE